jgi:hypothetical protein
MWTGSVLTLRFLMTETYHGAPVEQLICLTATRARYPGVDPT